MEQRFTSNILFCLLFLCGVFLIPDCFISRHITTGVLGIALLVIASVGFLGLRNKLVRITMLSWLLILFSLIWLSYQFFNASTTWYNWVGYISCVLLFYILSQLDFNKERLEHYYFIGSLAGVCMGSWGILQYFGIVRSYYALVPVTASFENPAALAIFLSSLFPFNLYFLKKQGMWNKIWGYSTCLLVIFVVVLSNSRTGILILLVIGMLYGCRNLFRQHWGGGKKRYLFVGIMACIILFLIGLYYWKKDSADGRILIWLCSLELFQDHWLFGIGSGRFQAGYMLYQAEYFRQNPDSVFAMLADNVRHPFNEYLKILVEYGMLGFTLFAVIFVHVVKIYQRNREKRFLLPVFGSVLAIALSGCFSYPLDYPGISLVLVLGVAMLATYDVDVWKIRGKIQVRILDGILVSCTLVLASMTCLYGYSEFEWNRIAKTSLAGKTGEMLPRYREMYRWLNRDGLFLYNFGAELYQTDRYEESLKILEECCSYFNDVDVQLLLAENYSRLGIYPKMERCLLLASEMCPVRFVPLFKLMNLHEETGNITKAKFYARIIIDKPVKIKSSRVVNMKEKARVLLRRYSDVSIDVGW